MNKHSFRRVAAGILLLMLSTCLGALADESAPLLSFAPESLVNDQDEFSLAGIPWELSAEEVEAALGLSLGESVPWETGDRCNYSPELGLEFPGLDGKYPPDTRLYLTFKEGKFSAAYGTMAIRGEGETSFASILQAYEEVFGPYEVYKEDQEPILLNDVEALKETHNVYWVSETREDGSVTMLQLRLAMRDKIRYNLSIAVYRLDVDQL